MEDPFDYEPDKKPRCQFCRQPGRKYAGTCSRYCFEQENATILQCLITEPRKIVDKDGRPVNDYGRGKLGDI